jgi:hypothetical protein
MLITNFEFASEEGYNNWKVVNSGNSDSFQFISITPPEKFPATLKLFPDTKNPNVWSNFTWSYPETIEDMIFFSPY